MPLFYELQKKSKRTYSPVWEAIKKQFILKTKVKVRVEVAEVNLKTVVRMVQKEKYEDNSWGLSSLTKLIHNTTKADSGFVIVEFELKPHNRSIIVSNLLESNKTKVVDLDSNETDFKL